MNENTLNDCLFIGGTADGEWLEVDSSKTELKLPSLSGQPALQDPVARALDNDPIPDETVVYEIYRRIEVEGEDGTIHVYALNALSPEAVQVQMVKYFGNAVPEDEVFREMD